jgi:hypothetical protein
VARLDPDQAEERMRRWTRELARGKSLAQIARQEGISRQAAHDFIGKLPEGEKRTPQHFFVHKKSFDRAAKLIKKKFGLVTPSGVAAGNGSVGRFIEKVGEGIIVCHWNEEPDEVRTPGEVDGGG